MYGGHPLPHPGPELAGTPSLLSLGSGTGRELALSSKPPAPRALGARGPRSLPASQPGRDSALGAGSAGGPLPPSGPGGAGRAGPHPLRPAAPSAPRARRRPALPPPRGHSGTGALLRPRPAGTRLGAASAPRERTWAEGAPRTGRAPRRQAENRGARGLPGLSAALQAQSGAARGLPSPGVSGAAPPAAPLPRLRLGPEAPTRAHRAPRRPRRERLTAGAQAPRTFSFFKVNVIERSHTILSKKPVQLFTCKFGASLKYLEKVRRAQLEECSQNCIPVQARPKHRP